MIISAKTWRKAIPYWELYHEKAVKFKGYMYIVSTSFILFSSFMKLNTCVDDFPPPPLPWHKKEP